MSSRLTLILWVFVTAVAIFDVGFAWVHRHSFAEWELNPIAIHLASLLGLPAVLGLRLLSLGFGAAIISLAGRSLRNLGTVVVFGTHLALLGVYIHGYLG